MDIYQQFDEKKAEWMCLTNIRNPSYLDVILKIKMAAEKIEIRGSEALIEELLKEMMFSIKKGGLKRLFRDRGGTSSKIDELTVYLSLYLKEIFSSPSYKRIAQLYNSVALNNKPWTAESIKKAFYRLKRTRREDYEKINAQVKRQLRAV